MTFTDLLESIRKHYLVEFVEVLKSHDSAISEPILLDSSGNPATEGPYDLPIRLDVVPIKDGKPQDSIRIDTNDMISFGPITLMWENRLEVLLEPFQWNWVHLQAKGSSLNSAPIIEWFNDWFKVSEESGGPELLEVVHFLSDPLVESDSLCCEIDLGSAPVDAFVGLLDAVMKTGASSVSINQNAA